MRIVTSFEAPAARWARPAARRHRFPSRRLLLHAILLGGGVIWVYPFLWMLGSSLKSSAGFFREGLGVVPGELDWSNYADAWTGASFGQYFANTAVTTLCTVGLTVLCTSMAGYALARTRFPGQRLVAMVIGTTLFLHGGYTIVPIVDLVRGLGLLNTLWSIVVVNTARGLTVATFLFWGYFTTISREIEEAARLDGAGFNRLFWRVAFPLARPMSATVALFAFIDSWNSFFIPLAFTLGRPELRTLTVGMAAFVYQNSANWTYLCAGSVIMLAPIILVFVAVQRLFVESIAGAMAA